MHRRRSPAVLALLAIVTMLGAWAAAPLTVLADAYDDACASPTTTIGASSTTAIDVTSTSVVLIAAGTFQGGINSWASGGVICVAAPATLQPPYMNNAAGALYNRGHVVMPGTAVAGGFKFENFGQADFPSGFNANGTVLLANRVGGTWTMPNGFNTSGRFVNEATATFGGGFDLNSGGVIQNAATMTIAGSVNINGSLQNTGVLTLGSSLTVNGGARIDNACVLKVAGAFNNNQTVANTGWISLGTGTTWQNNGTLGQSPEAITTGTNMTNSGSVLGFGTYVFTGSTITQGTFSGTSASNPIVFDDRSPTVPGQIFDVQNGTVTNVIAATVGTTRLQDLPFQCAVAPAITANITAVQSGPAVVGPGDPITYTITVVNQGPSIATGVVVTEQLPAALTGVTASGGGTVGATTVTWNVGTMAPGVSVTFTVTGTAPASGTLLAVVSATSTSDDPKPNDNDGSRPDAKVTTLINAPPPPNLPPVVDDVAIQTVAGTAVGGVVPMSDPDPGQTVYAAISTPPGHGIALIATDGTFTFHPTGTFTGVDTFVVTGCDNGSPVLCDTGTVTLTYVPLPGDDTAETSDGIPVNIAVGLNDIGDTGPPSVVAGPSNGTATVEADGSITYAPTPGFTGTDSFDYEVCSEVTPSICAQATVTIEVAPAPNQPPIVGDAAVSTTATVAVNGSVAVTDPDAGQTVTMIVAVQALHGTATIDDTGAFTYTPTGAFTGTDVFLVVGCDDGDPILCDGGIVTVTVNPLAGDDAASTTDGVPVNVDIAANDIGTVGAPTVVSGPTNGTTTIEADGTITYAPTPGFTGTDTFDYEICSTITPTVCATATVTVVVSAAPNLPPVVGDATASTTATVQATGNVTVSDPDAGQTVTMTVSVTAINGTATVDDTGAFTYTPTGTFTGTDTFTVQGCDDGTPSLCDTGLVTVTVSPVAGDDAATTTDGVPVNVDIAANDLGTVGAPTIVVAPGNGTTTVESDGTITYSPTPGFTGTDSFDYRICSTVTPTVCATATVTVDVAAIPNEPPVVGDASAATTATVQATGSVSVSDPDAGQTITMTVTVGAANGTATVDDSGAFTYTPTGTSTGTDTFTVEGCDDGTPSLCDTGVVTVTVSPLAVDDAATTTDGTPVEVDVQANDIGDTGAPTIVTPPTDGTAVIGSIIYTPNPGFAGTDQVTYQVCSPNAQAVCDTAVLTITVTAAPTPVPTDTPPPTDASRDPFRAVPGGAAMLAACAVLAATVAAAGAVAYRRRSRVG